MMPDYYLAGIRNLFTIKINPSPMKIKTIIMERGLAVLIGIYAALFIYFLIRVTKIFTALKPLSMLNVDTRAEPYYFDRRSDK